MKHVQTPLVLSALIAGILLALPGGRCPAGEPPWSFVVLADPKPESDTADDAGIQKSFGKDLMYLKETWIDKADANRPAPAFVLVPGDFAPAEVTDQTFAKVLGAEFPWLPVVGNHDLSSRPYMAKVLARYEKKLGIHYGPRDGSRGQYEFAFRNVQFVAMDQYSRGDVAAADDDEANLPAAAGPARYAWVAGTLKASKTPYRIVMGHEPAWPFHNHTNDPLHAKPDERDRFWRMLAEANCQAYLCGHTHVYSTYRWLGNGDPGRWQDYTSRIIPDPLGVWQIDAGRSAGLGHSEDRVLVHCRVTEECIQVETHVSAKGPGGFTPWRVPPDGKNATYRFKIYPEAKSNLPPAAPKAGATTRAAAP